MLDDTKLRIARILNRQRHGVRKTREANAVGMRRYRRWLVGAPEEQGLVTPATTDAATGDRD